MLQNVSKCLILGLILWHLFISTKKTGDLPGISIDKGNWNLPSELQLAYETFYKQSKVNVLIVIEIFVYSLGCMLGEGHIPSTGE
jgi:hypothetical protein